jgi:choline kinase
MRGLILAAGRGSRMGALTADAPKCLTQLGARTLLDRQISSLRAGGCTDVGIVTGYRAELISSRGDAAFHNPDWASSNMVRSLAGASSWLGDGTVIVSYSDIFYSGETVRALGAAVGALAISYDPDWLALWSARFTDPLSDAETFRRDAAGRLVEIGARAERLEQIEGQYMGLLKFTPAGWAEVVVALDVLEPERRARIDMTSLLAGLLARNVAITTVPVVGPWGECDNPSDLAVYEEWVAAGRIAP